MNDRAIAGLVTAGATILLIAIVAIIMLSRQNARRDYARSVFCASNVRQIGLACALYADKHDGRLPRSLDDLADMIQPTKVFICRSAKDQTYYSYAFTGVTNRWGENSDIVILQEIEANHYGGRYVLYDDGRVELKRNSR